MKKFLLRTAYLCFKGLVKLMFKVYYPDTLTDNLSILNTKGPVLLLSNHPNGMIDPLDIALRSNRMVHFLAKAELFNHLVLHWFFSTFYCIPIERPDFSNGQVVDNTENFNRCNRFLQGGGALYIAPEGTSELVRRLLNLKTGAARIALQAEASMDFKMGIKIIPSGITYVDQGEFRSSQYICASEPITIQHFKELYYADPRNAVVELTELIKQRLSELIIILDNDNQIPLFESLMIILHYRIKQNPKEFFIEGKELANKLNDFNIHNIDIIQKLEKEVVEIDTLLEKNSVRANDVEEILTNWEWKKWLVHFIVTILGFPLFLYGSINHLIANIVPWAIERLAKFHIIYRSTMKMLIGLISYILFYGLQLLIIWNLCKSLNTLIIYIISLVLSGLWFYPYLKWSKRLICHCKGHFIPLSEKNELNMKIITLKHLINN
jgi:glycerol-3-phosphate O-acyltransferase / dihydroxyacetone phosphate acyltransferase